MCMKESEKRVNLLEKYRKVLRENSSVDHFLFAAIEKNLI